MRVLKDKKGKDVFAQLFSWEIMQRTPIHTHVSKNLWDSHIFQKKAKRGLKQWSVTLKLKQSMKFKFKILINTKI